MPKFPHAYPTIKMIACYLSKPSVDLIKQSVSSCFLFFFTCIILIFMITIKNNLEANLINSDHHAIITFIIFIFSFHSPAFFSSPNGLESSFLSVSSLHLYSFSLGHRYTHLAFLLLRSSSALLHCRSGQHLSSTKYSVKFNKNWNLQLEIRPYWAPSLQYFIV